MSTVFDKYADNYDDGHTKAVKMSGFTPAYFHEYKLKEVQSYLLRKGFLSKKLNILNFGCGTGNSEPYIKKYLPDSKVYAIDVSAECIKTAIQANSALPDVYFQHFDGVNIPFDVKFDVILAANVFHHIKRSQHLNVLNNIRQKIADQGFFFMFELNPLNPLTMLVALKNDYKFDENANLLTPMYANKVLKEAGFSDREIRFTIFFPKCCSLIIPYEKYLAKVPLGAHYCYVAKK